MSNPSYLDILNPEQLEAVKHANSPLLILAGAGSGKTRVITTKIAYLIERGVDPRSILAVTFTKKAAKEMQERSYRLDERCQFVQIRTFHSFGSWFLRVYASLVDISPNFTVYDDDDSISIISKAVKQLTRVEAAKAAHKIARAKDYCLTPDDDLSLVDSDPCFQEIYAQYQTRLRETGNVDFGDLILLPLQILQSNAELQQRVQSRFKVILVDEYQDSNVAQFSLLQALTGKDTYICVVGDDDQSIYRFRGAEVKNILTFQNHFEGTKIIRLEKNYRSVEPILNTAGQVVECNTGRLGKNLQAVRGKGKIPTLVFLANQDEETAFCADLIKSAYKKGCPYSDWAILYRTNAQSLGFETEFLQRKIPYKVVGSLKFYNREEIKDALAYLAVIANPRDEINFSRIINKPARGIGAVSQEKIIEQSRQSLQPLQESADSDVLFDSNASISEKHEKGLLFACKKAMPKLSKKTQQGVSDFIHIFETLVDEFAHDRSQQKQDGYSIENIASDALNQTEISKQAPEHSLSSFIESVIKKTGLSDYHQAQDEIAGTQRVTNLQELANSATLYPKTLEGLLQFLDHIELDRAAAEEDDNIDAVTLITLHNTKGLEFPRVIITGIEKGIFPRQDKTLDELEEERRLFYVGITRAKDELYLTTCAMRRLYGKTAFVEPSPFLSEIEVHKLDVLGKKPASFGRAYRGTNGVIPSVNNKNDPLAQRWKVGVQVFHDDLGYGVIAKSAYEEDELIISVAFEGGTQKRFIPQYQANKLLIVKE
ncbi:MAG: ATP-dependent helicase [Treponemataceae bacterium]